MSGGAYRIFISAVSTEFGHARDMLANSLQARGLDVKIQRAFRNEHDANTTLEKLFSYISGCDAVVGVVGNRSGAFPPGDAVSQEFRQMLPEGIENASYTQWEIIFALHCKVRLSLHEATDTYRPDRDADDDDPQAQLKWRDFLFDKVSGLDRKQFGTPDALRANVLEEDWPQVRAFKPRNLPHASIGNLFKGREETMQSLAQELGRGKNAGSETCGVALHGLGGVGKSRLAVEYALKNESNYNALLFVTGNSQEELKTSLASLGGAMVLDLPEKNILDLEVRLAAVIRWLQSNPGWLLLIDNVDSKEAAIAVEAMFANLAGGHVIVTSRVSDWSAQFSPIRVDALSALAAKELLLAETPARRKSDDDDEVAGTLSERLGHLALALRQAGAYINQRRLPLGDYLALFDKSAARLLGEKGYDKQLTAYPVSVAATWDVTFEQLNEDAQQLLQALSFLSFEQIPEGVLDRAETSAKHLSEFIGEPLEEDDDDVPAREHLLELERYSFVTFDDDTPEFSIHRLVQQITREKMTGEERAAAQSYAAYILLFAAASLNPSGFAVSEIQEQLIPHALHFFSIADPDGMEEHLLNGFSLLYARVLSSTGRNAKAEEFYLKGIDTIEFADERFRLDAFYQALMGLGGLQMDLGRFDDAESNLLKASELLSSKEGSKFSVEEKLRNYDFLATCYLRSFQLEKAEEVFAKIQATRNEHGLEPSLAQMSHYAILLRNSERYDEAEAIWEDIVKNLDDAEELSPGSKGDILNSYAVLKMKTDRYDEAVVLLNKAFLHFDENNPSDAGHMANAFRNLACSEQQLGQIDNARDYYKQSLNVYYKTEENDWVKVRAIVDEYCVMEWEREQYESAVELQSGFLQVLLDRIASGSPQFPTFLGAFADLLSMFVGLNDVAAVRTASSEILEALSPFKSDGAESCPYIFALRIKVFAYEKLGLLEEIESDIAQILSSRTDLSDDRLSHTEATATLLRIDAEIKQNSDRLESAEQSALKALGILGDAEDREKTKTFAQLAEIQLDLEKPDAALESATSAVKLFQADEDEWDVGSAAFAYHLSLQLGQLEKFEEAERLMRQALDYNQNFYGNSHPESMSVKGSLVYLCMRMDKHEEADALAEELIASLASFDVESDEFEMMCEVVMDAFVAVKFERGHKPQEVEQMANSYFSHISGEKFHITITDGED